MKKVGVEYRDLIKNDRRVYGVPYDVWDEDLYVGEGEPISINGKNWVKASWLLERYMVECDIELFDFVEDWTEEVEKEYREYLEYFEERR